MNRFLSLAAAVVIFSTPGFAEEMKEVPRPPRTATPEPPKLTRFDLDFPGGTPGELVEAISKAIGKRVNLIIPERDAEVRIMPIRVEDVNVAELFSAIATASDHDVPYVSSQMGGSATTTQWRKGGVRFHPAPVSHMTDGTAWSFSSVGPSVEELAMLNSSAAQPMVCRYFQLGPYLRNHTIEDITTAIQTGWKMSGVEPVPELSFHKETNLLIAVGPERQVDQIPMVLAEIAKDNWVALRTIETLQAEIEEITAAKDAGWEQEVEKRNQRIRQAAAQRKALQALENPPPAPPSIRRSSPNP